MITPYTPAIEESMKAHYNKLDEKTKRSYLAIEAEKLGHWWKSYVVWLFKCSHKRIRRGQTELKEEKKKGVRLPWWWPKPKIEKDWRLVVWFDKVIEQYTAGSPVKEGTKRTNLKPSEIVRKMKEDEWIETSVYIVKQIILHRELWQRGFHKWKTLKTVEGRNEQFENIKDIKEKSDLAWNPVISVDTKKKSKCENLLEHENTIQAKEYNH